MRRLISFVGNICSGKSTISNIVAKTLAIEVFSIDEFRKKHQAFLINGEWAAWDDLKQSISGKEIAILESSGLSQNVRDIYSFFDETIIVLIDCPSNILIKRIAEREASNYEPVPFCYARKTESVEKRVADFGKLLSAIKPNFIFNSHEMDVEEISKRVIEIINNSLQN